MPEPSPTMLIYITGYGRSGSTLLDIALGQHRHVLGSGEVGALTRHVWANDEYCACGQRVRSCRLWAEAVTAWDGDDRYLQSQRRTEGLVSWRRLLPLRQFRTQTARLFQSLARQSGRPIVVDSSKLPGRGFALASNPSVEIYAVHLVRDPRAVVWSMRKAFKQQVDAGLQKELQPKPLLYSAARWMLVNLGAEALRMKVGRQQSLRVRYEDFVAAPAETVERVLQLVGERPDDGPDGLLRPLEPHHQVAGSRHRMQKKLTIRMDERWQAEMSVAKQWMVALCCAPLLLRYGYPWRPQQAASAKEALAS